MLKLKKNIEKKTPIHIRVYQKKGEKNKGTISLNRKK